MRKRSSLLRRIIVFLQLLGAVSLVVAAYALVTAEGSEQATTRDPFDLSIADGPPGPTAVTGAPDLAGPDIGPIGVSELLISEVESGDPTCPDLPGTTEVNVRVVDSSEVRQVDLEFRVGDTSGGLRMSRAASDRFSAVLGDFFSGTVSDESPIGVVVVATDETGQTTRRSLDVPLLLRSCALNGS